MINIGDMNKKIEIYGFGWDKDELGQKIRKEKLIARVWAKVRLIRSSESIKLLKNEATEEMQFTIRYRKGIDKNNYKAKMYLCPSALQGDEDAIELLIKHDELFDANSTERFYNFIMCMYGEAIGNGDPKGSPDIALFALTRALREKGLTGYELIGVIASKLYELAIQTMGKNDCVKINFWKLAKKWALE